MVPCVRAKELAIDHVRNPGERMPICRMKCGERPSKSRERNTAIHVWIFPDIRGVIESDELMPDYLGVNSKRHHRETEQDDEIGSLQTYIMAKRDDTWSFCRCNMSSFPFSCRSVRHLSQDYQRRTIEIATNFLCRLVLLESQRIAAGIAASTVSQ